MDNFFYVNSQISPILNLSIKKNWSHSFFMDASDYVFVIYRSDCMSSILINNCLTYT